VSTASILESLRAWWRPAVPSWRQRIDGMAALPKANPPRVKYEVPDARVRPKVQNFREWLQRYDSRKAG